MTAADTFPPFTGHPAPRDSDRFHVARANLNAAVQRLEDAEAHLAAHGDTDRFAADNRIRADHDVTEARHALEDAERAARRGAK